MNSEELFLATMADLRCRTSVDANDYNLRQAAGLIRRLCFDDHPLAWMVNETYNLELTCEWYLVRIATAARNGGAWVPLLWSDPMTWSIQKARWAGLEPPEPVVKPLDAFLEYPLLIRDDESATAETLIRDYANRRGGVHHDPREPQDRLLSDVWAESVYALDLTVLSAARIVYAALEPLAATVTLSGRPHPYGIQDVARLRMTNPTDEPSAGDAVPEGP